MNAEEISDDKMLEHIQEALHLMGLKTTDLDGLTKGFIHLSCRYHGTKWENEVQMVLLQLGRRLLFQDTGA